MTGSGARGQCSNAGWRWHPAPHHSRVSTPIAAMVAAIDAAAPTGVPTTQTLDTQRLPQPGWKPICGVSARPALRRWAVREKRARSAGPAVEAGERHGGGVLRQLGVGRRHLRDARAVEAERGERPHALDEGVVVAGDVAAFAGGDGLGRVQADGDGHRRASSAVERRGAVDDHRQPRPVGHVAPGGEVRHTAERGDRHDSRRPPPAPRRSRRRSAAGSSIQVSGSTSTKYGVRPAAIAAWALATKVQAGIRQSVARLGAGRSQRQRQSDGAVGDGGDRGPSRPAARRAGLSSSRTSGPWLAYQRAASMRSR